MSVSLALSGHKWHVFASRAYVQVPCIVRNMAAVPTAVTCANAALAGMDHIVPLDDVVALMLAVGEKIRPCDEAGTYILKKEEE